MSKTTRDSTQIWHEELQQHQDSFGRTLRQLVSILSDADVESRVLLPALVTQLVIVTCTYLQEAYALDPELFLGALLSDVRHNLAVQTPLTTDWKVN